MKKNILIGFIACIVSLSLISKSQAQQSVNNFKDNARLLAKPKLFVMDFDKNSFQNARRSEFSTKAVRDFASRFCLAENVKWYKTSNRLIVYFTENAIKNRAVYNIDGSWFYTIRFYPVEYLPKEVRTQVEDEFYGFSITFINEIKNNNQVSYVVHMQDKTRWRNIMVREGEMEVVEELLKPE
ncbi:MAG: hypothetical protein ABIN89_12670 [Chitinophagaceae bacterium]